ncbi:MAG: hypothetical protein HUU10_07110 [Bacteroidetes bacterium]|nr:hypothetical protein [Bacteroidota bacterium]
MKTVGILFGMENTFPFALADSINKQNHPAIRAEVMQLGHQQVSVPMKYDLIVDRISQDVPFYRSMLKNAALTGSFVINNPFWWSADDKFINCTLAEKVGVAVPKTVLIPSKERPSNTQETSFRNLMYPLDWEGIFSYLGFPLFMKPYDGGGWRDVYKIHDREEFWSVYETTGQVVMMLQEAIEFDSYYRCYGVGRQYVHIMPYEPRNPHHLRYHADPSKLTPALKKRISADVLKLCTVLGYDLNTVEFAVRDGIPYAIDFMNPAPDADIKSVTEPNFEWIVGTMTRFLTDLAESNRQPDYPTPWQQVLGPVGRKPAAKTKSTRSAKK